MRKTLKKIVTIIFLLSSSNIYALNECSGAGPYSWHNCTGSSELVNGMSWKGEYQRGGPNGNGKLSADFGDIEGVITSSFGVVTGISGKAYTIYKKKRTIVMEIEDLVMDELSAGGLIGKGTFYFPEFTINGYMIPDDTYTSLKYVGRLIQADGQSGYVVMTSKAIDLISEGTYQIFDQQYREEFVNYRKARTAELTKLFANADRNKPNYQKKHAKELATSRALRLYYLTNGDKNKPSPYLFDSFIKNLQAID